MDDQPSLGAPPLFNLFHSSAVDGDMGALLGAPHYSYRFAEAKFQAALVAQGLKSTKLKMPEYYGSESALPATFGAPGLPSIHMIFRSTEQIRLLKFAWNIVCFAWEFDVIKDDTLPEEHPLLNQKRMLTICDEIWVPCSYTQNVLASYGIAHTFVIPAPIPRPSRVRTALLDGLAELGHITVAPLVHNFLLSKRENAERCADQSSTLGMYLTHHHMLHGRQTIYLSILNPEDSRKNLDAMLRAFQSFAKRNPEAVLIVKALTSATRFTLFDVLGDVIPHKLASGTAFSSPNIIFFNDYLSASALETLYGIADFYLCASLCEGQNLPLLEAMAHGVVPITTTGTAMSDYIRPDNAIVIHSEHVENTNPHLAGTLAKRPFKVWTAGSWDIYEALLRSVELSEESYRALAANAQGTVTANYSVDAVWSLMRARFAAIVAGRYTGAERVARRL